MQKVEKWRLQELTNVLDEIIQILLSCDQQEWAAVFRHYSSECGGLLQKPLFDSAGILNLVRNIQSCLKEGQSLRTLAAVNSVSQDRISSYQLLILRIAYLEQILIQVEARFLEPVH